MLEHLLRRWAKENSSKKSYIEIKKEFGKKHSWNRAED